MDVAAASYTRAEANMTTLASKPFPHANRRMEYRTATLTLVLALSVGLAGCGGEAADDAVRDVPAEETSSTSDFSVDAEEGVRAVLEEQAEAWNRGSISGYMEGYARSDTLRFASGGDVWYGWDRTMTRYQASYADEGQMGTLSFTDVDVWPLSPDHAVVFGRWELDRSESFANTGGLFTLVFERSPEGWRIVHDHTSAREPINPQPQDAADATR